MQHLSMAVPRTVADAAQRARDISPGHRFCLYFAGWWTREFEEARLRRLQEELRKAPPGKRRNLQRRTAESKQRLDTQVSFSTQDDEAKAEHAYRLPLGPSAEGLLQALRDRQRALVGPNALVLDVELLAPLAVGLGAEHPTENGFRFLDPYGLPVLPGSSIKGAVRRAAELLCLERESGWSPALVWWLFGFDATSAIFAFPKDVPPDPVGEAERARYCEWAEELPDEDCPLVERLMDLVFDENDPARPSELRAFLLDWLAVEAHRRKVHLRGALVFEDALPAIGEEGLVKEIMNPHARSYLQTSGEGGGPSDAEDPNPIYFVAVPTGSRLQLVVRFAPPVGAPAALGERWRPALEKALRLAAEELGFGAKTTRGYGVGRLVEEGGTAPASTGPGAAESLAPAGPDPARLRELLGKRDRQAVEQSLLALLAGQPGEVQADVRADFREAGFSVDSRDLSALRHLLRSYLGQRVKKIRRRVRDRRPKARDEAILAAWARVFPSD